MQDDTTAGVVDEHVRYAQLATIRLGLNARRGDGGGRCGDGGGRGEGGGWRGGRGDGGGWRAGRGDASAVVVAAATKEAEHEVEGRLLLEVVVGEGAAVLELLAREDQALLVGRDALLVLDLGLDV